MLDTLVYLLRRKKADPLGCLRLFQIRLPINGNPNSRTQVELHQHWKHKSSLARRLAHHAIIG